MKFINSEIFVTKVATPFSRITSGTWINLNLKNYVKFDLSKIHFKKQKI